MLADENEPSQTMRNAIDSPRGRALYSRRIATVEPVFANIRHHKGMRRFTLRGKIKVSTQWQLYCLVHNITRGVLVGEQLDKEAMRCRYWKTRPQGLTK
jgi:Transposase DDE domain